MRLRVRVRVKVTSLQTTWAGRAPLSSSGVMPEYLGECDVRMRVRRGRGV